VATALAGSCSRLIEKITTQLPFNQIFFIRLPTDWIFWLQSKHPTGVLMISYGHYSGLNVLELVMYASVLPFFLLPQN
jgi:hypothetical protein